MRTLRNGIFLIGALFSYSSAAAPRTILNHFSRCSGEIDGSTIELDFFEEFDIKKESPNGSGLVIQTIHFGKESMKIIGHLDLTKGKDATKVIMRTALDPDVVFSEFQLSATRETKVEIRDKSRSNALWGNFQCKPMGLLARSAGEGVSEEENKGASQPAQ
ncbi:MAG: hypothetical protein HUU37_06050 [Bdellovibrionales bacterium]|nr:hypothetical protein [Bdellovibrionales bacterium]